MDILRIALDPTISVPFLNKAHSMSWLGPVDCVTDTVRFKKPVIAVAVVYFKRRLGEVTTVKPSLTVLSTVGERNVSVVLALCSDLSFSFRPTWWQFCLNDLC